MKSLIIKALKPIFADTVDEKNYERSFKYF